MLINIADPHKESSSGHPTEEDRILSEITSINRQLRAKMNSETGGGQQMDWDRKREEGLFVQKKGFNIKDSSSPPICSANAEYFS